MKQLFACAVAVAAVAGALGLSTANGAAGSRPRSGLHAAVHISGRWTVTVRSHSGRVRRRVRFENALVGTSVLPSLLAGTAVIGNWEIRGAETAGDGSSLTPTSDPARLKEWDGTSSTAPMLQITATLPVTAGGTIASLSTTVQLCAPSLGPADCRASTAQYVPFTSRGGLAVPVKAGDTVTFTVQITPSFGSAASRFGAFGQTLVQLLEGRLVPRSWGLYLHSDLGDLGGDATMPQPGNVTTMQANGGSLQVQTSGVFDPSASGGTAPSYDFSQGKIVFLYCSPMAVTSCVAPVTPASATITFHVSPFTLQPGQQYSATYTLGFS